MANFSLDIQTASNQWRLWNVTVTNGEITKISIDDKVVDFSWIGGCSGTVSVYTPEDHEFEAMLRNFIKLLYENDRPKYEEFVNEVNQSVRDKYLK